MARGARRAACTIVSVSHHPSTAVAADRIIALEQGVVAEEGTYDELIARDAIFANLVKAGA